MFVVFKWMHGGEDVEAGEEELLSAELHLMQYQLWSEAPSAGGSNANSLTWPHDEELYIIIYIKHGDGPQK